MAHPDHYFNRPPSRWIDRLNFNFIRKVLSRIKEFDDNGWAVIHHMVAAEKPLLNQVRIFCDADKNLLDLQTRDQYKYTPLLLARL